MCANFTNGKCRSFHRNTTHQEYAVVCSRSQLGPIPAAGYCSLTTPGTTCQLLQTVGIYSISGSTPLATNWPCWVRTGVVALRGTNAAHGTTKEVRATGTAKQASVCRVSTTMAFSFRFFSVLTGEREPRTPPQHAPLRSGFCWIARPTILSAGAAAGHGCQGHIGNGSAGFIWTNFKQQSASFTIPLRSVFLSRLAPMVAEAIS